MKEAKKPEGLTRETAEAILEDHWHEFYRAWLVPYAEGEDMTPLALMEEYGISQQDIASTISSLESIMECEESHCGVEGGWRILGLMNAKRILEAVRGR